MSFLDDSLRGAFHDVADEIPADSLPPLALPPRRRRRPGLTNRDARRPGSRRSRAWIAAAGSAVLVAAVVAAAGGIAVALNGRQAETRLPAGASPAQLGQRAAAGHAAAPAADDGVPGYYVALVQAGTVAHPSRRVNAVVRATRTGAVLATVTVPRPYDTFTEITGAADDKVWILSAQKLSAKPQRITTKLTPFEPERLFALHVNPSARTAAQRAQLTPLPASYLPAGSQTWDMALSPDGTKLAAAIGANTPMMGQGPTKLEVFDLATGSRHEWDGAGQLGLGFVDPSQDGWLSWAADERTLAFVSSKVGLDEIRLLNPAASGTRLLASSRLAATMPIGFSAVAGVLLTSDGQYLLAVKEVPAAPGYSGPAVSQDLLKISVATGKRIAVLNHARVSGGFEQVLWASPSARTLVMSRVANSASADILQDGHDIAIPWSGTILTAAW
jgi:hypothetical protein